MGGEREREGIVRREVLEEDKRGGREGLFEKHYLLCKIICGLAKKGNLEMAKGLVWATAEDLARNRGRVLSLYRQILRGLNSPDIPLNLAARLAKKAEVRAIFLLGSEERSLHNIEDLIDAAEYSLSLLKKGEIPKHIQ
ncbi:unnamed protein product [Fraxinus pennsylvanica]|uniref:LYR motif containing domain-containing protein n=1 Tax=Fraxinus pennsylvanica TaxID=56036 RepID=A0AAD1YWK7_9LAMI|nr:unnamed protein product [Fraxinus pennsylvanica]